MSAVQGSQASCRVCFRVHVVSCFQKEMGWPLRDSTGFLRCGSGFSRGSGGSV